MNFIAVIKHFANEINDVVCVLSFPTRLCLLQNFRNQIQVAYHQIYKYDGTLKKEMKLCPPIPQILIQPSCIIPILTQVSF